MKAAEANFLKFVKNDEVFTPSELAMALDLAAPYHPAAGYWVRS